MNIRSILFVLLGISVAAAQDSKTVTIQSPGGDITYKERKLSDKGKFEDRVEPLSKDELANLQRDSGRAQEFINAFVQKEDRNESLLENLDTAFAAWLKTGSQEKYRAKDVIDIVGAAYGNYCIQHLGVHWARVTDQWGTTIALISENPPARSFPFTSIQYRIEDKQSDFIYGLYVILEKFIKEAKK